MTSDCPSDTMLRLLGTGSFGETTFAGSERHIETCERCQNFLQSLVDNDLHQRTQGGIVSASTRNLPHVPGFEVERELGRGSNGVVFLARDTRLDRLVGLKFLVDGVAGAPNRSLVLSEARAVSRLTHRNVVQLYQVVEVDEWAILVLEYLPGGTLKERLTAPLAPRDAAAILEQLSATIGHIHDEGFLHLDIKPSNILIDGEPGCTLEPSRLKISDFGIALRLAEPIADHDLQAGPRGTPSYMAPEQTGGGNTPIDRRADVYALGALLYHLLTGRPPFESSSSQETLELVRTVEPVSPRQLNPQIPRDLETICLHCLKKAPQDRYSSADELVADLRRFLDGRPIAVRPVSSLEHAIRWCRRRPAIAALAMVLTVTIVVSLCGLIVLLNRSEAERDQAILARKLAEDNEYVASRTLEEFAEWVERIASDPAILTVEDYNTPFDIEEELAASMMLGDGESVERMVGTVNRLNSLLARNLSTLKAQLPEAEDLLKRSSAHLRDCIQRKPEAAILREEYFLTLIHLRNIAHFRECYEEADEYSRKLVELLPTIERNQRRLDLSLVVSRNRRYTAYMCVCAGDYTLANRMLSANLQMLNSVSPEHADNPEVRLEKVLTHSLLGHQEETGTAVQLLVSMQPGKWIGRVAREDAVGEWIALSAVGTLSRARYDAHTAMAGDAYPTNFLTMESVQRAMRRLKLDVPTVPRVSFRLCKRIADYLATKRRQHHVQEMTMVETRLLAFAEDLVVTYPKDTNSHMVQSEAHIQVAKNAWNRGADDDAIEALRLALMSAETALAVDPDVPEVQRFLEDRKRRLLRAESERATLTPQ